MKGFSWVLPGGEIINPTENVTLVNNTAKTVLKTVPAGKRWFLYSVRAYNGDDVQRNILIYIRDAADETLHELIADAAVGATSWSAQKELSCPIPLKAGYDIVYVYATGGASTGGTGKAVAEILEITET